MLRIVFQSTQPNSLPFENLTVGVEDPGNYDFDNYKLYAFEIKNGEVVHHDLSDATQVEGQKRPGPVFRIGDDILYIGNGQAYGLPAWNEQYVFELLNPEDFAVEDGQLKRK